MFHITNLGSFGQGLQRYADMKGCLPDSADELLVMDYDLSADDLNPETGEWDQDLRTDFFEEASAAINEASEKLSEWQSQQ